MDIHLPRVDAAARDEYRCVRTIFGSRQQMNRDLRDPVAVRHGDDPSLEVKREELRAAADRKPVARPRQIRARYANGVLVPTGPLDLPEGAEVVMDIRLPLKE